jgi:hypothetical protein
MLKRCDWHPKKERGYIAWHHWAEEQDRKGIKQIQCKGCQHWFFPSEFGTPVSQEGVKDGRKV